MQRPQQNCIAPEGIVTLETWQTRLMMSEANLESYKVDFKNLVVELALGSDVAEDLANIRDDMHTTILYINLCKLNIKRATLLRAVHWRDIVVTAPIHRRALGLNRGIGFLNTQLNR